MLLFWLTRATHAEPAPLLTEAETQGRALALKILEQRPAENTTNRGTLTVRRGSSQRLTWVVTCETTVTETNWLTRYSAGPDTNRAGEIRLSVTHAGTAPNQYLSTPSAGAPSGEAAGGSPALTPFAGSDFWGCDLGLEFLHWPRQAVLKKEFHRNCPCTVLESTNPDPSPGTYLRVVCWIDNDSLGIVEAYAYDAQGKKLKNFYPKNLAKVNDRYQVESMIMENLQTGSRSRLDFDLN